MSASETGTVRPGLSVGPTSEFSLFFRVKPGEGEDLRAALRDLQETPGYRPGDYGMAIATIHEARFVLFDDDTRLAFITSFDGPWDAYMEDFFTSGPTLALFDVIFRHVEGYEGLPDLQAVKAFVLGAEADGGGVSAELRRHREGDQKGPACERRVPAGARRSGRRRGAPASRAEAAARRGGRLARRRGRRCRITSRDRGRWRSRSRTSRTCTRFQARSGRGIWCSCRTRSRLRSPRRCSRTGSSTASGCARSRREPGAILRRSPSPTKSSCSTACFPIRPRATAREDRKAYARRRRATRSPFEVNDEQGGSGHGVRVFAGPRWDPFIMDAPAALKTIATGKLAFTDPGAIYMDGKNVLSLVVEVDCAQLLNDVELVGVVAETLTRGKLAVRIERVGRPEVKNMMLAPKQFDPVNRDLEIRDLYNMEDAFHLADGLRGRIPGAAQRQSRLLGRPRRQDGLAHGR